MKKDPVGLRSLLVVIALWSLNAALCFAPASADPSAPTPHAEVSLAQSTFIGSPWGGFIGSLHGFCFKPWGDIKIDVFGDGGLKISESPDHALIGGLAGISGGIRGSAIPLRLFVGCEWGPRAELAAGIRLPIKTY